MSVNKKRLAKFQIETTSQAEEAVCEIANEIFGEYPVVLNNVKTGATYVIVYTDKNPDRLNQLKSQLIERLNPLKESGFDVGSLDIKIEPVKYEDWSESWKRHFKPLRFSKILLIKPQWSKARASAGTKVVILNPGIAFGTGQHATTKFCLKQIVKFRPNKSLRSFLDVGTGSGILAISAAKLGYSPVVAFDNDPVAVNVAIKNARRNRVEEKIRFYRKNLLNLSDNAREKYDFICANLTADLLIDAKIKLINRLKPDGKLVLAGILTNQFEAVKNAYLDSGLELLLVKEENEWKSGLFIYRGGDKKQSD